MAIHRKSLRSWMKYCRGFKTEQPFRERIRPYDREETDEGTIIPPEPENENSSLHPCSMMDRPHIIYNFRTRKYVCWLKIMNQNGRQTGTVLTSEHILGPYKKVREGLRPLGMDAGDFDLAVAPDGKAYYYFERVHSETICANLTDDYTNVTGYYSTHFPHPHPPYVREATAHFTRIHRYLIMYGSRSVLKSREENPLRY